MELLEQVFGPPPRRFTQALAGLCKLGMTACSGATGGTKPKFANKNEHEVSVIHTGWTIPRAQALADSHCEQFGKSAVYKGAIRISELSDRQIYYFDCVFPALE